MFVFIHIRKSRKTKKNVETASTARDTVCERVQQFSLQNVQRASTSWISTGLLNGLNLYLDYSNCFLLKKKYFIQLEVLQVNITVWRSIKAPTYKSRQAAAILWLFPLLVKPEKIMLFITTYNCSAHDHGVQG